MRTTNQIQLILRPRKWVTLVFKLQSFPLQLLPMWGRRNSSIGIHCLLLFNFKILFISFSCFRYAFISREIKPRKYLYMHFYSLYSFFLSLIWNSIFSNNFTSKFLIIKLTKGFFSLLLLLTISFYNFIYFLFSCKNRNTSFLLS